MHTLGSHTTSLHVYGRSCSAVVGGEPASTRAELPNHGRPRAPAGSVTCDTRRVSLVSVEQANELGLRKCARTDWARVSVLVPASVREASNSVALRLGNIDCLLASICAAPSPFAGD